MLWNGMNKGNVLFSLTTIWQVPIDRLDTNVQTVQAARIHSALMTAVSYTASARNWLSLSIWTRRTRTSFFSSLIPIFCSLGVAGEARCPPASDHVFINEENWAGQGGVWLTTHDFSTSFCFLEEGFRFACFPHLLPRGPQSTLLLGKHGYSDCVCPSSLCLFCPFKHPGMQLWLLPPQPSGNITSWGLRVLLEKNASDKWLWHAVREKGRVRRDLLSLLLGSSGESSRGNTVVWAARVDGGVRLDNS